MTGDHEQLDGLLDEIFAANESGDIDRTHQKLDLFWARLAMHIRAEHLHLFPAALEGANAEDDVAKTVKLLHEDHDFFMRELAGLIRSLRARRPGEILILDEIRASLSSVRRRLAAHNRIEEGKIYGLADGENAALIESLEKEITNLPARFGAAPEEE